MIHPSLFRLCVCGHQKRDHVFNVGSCIPGWMCETGCKQFIAQPSIEEREAALEAWKRAGAEQSTSGPRSATEATELRPGPDVASMTEEDFLKFLEDMFDRNGEY